MDVTVQILKWDKHNPRKDVKRPSWFPFDNRMIEDDDFFEFNHGEFKAWVYLLSKASQKQASTVVVSYEAAHRKANISVKDFRSSLEKLTALGIVTVDVTGALRPRDVDVTSQTDRQTIQTDITIQDEQHARVPSDDDFELLYSLYPRKEGKAKGLEKLKAFAKTMRDLERVQTAMARYIQHLRKNKTEAKFIKHFSSWMNSWTDWDSPDAGSSSLGHKNYESERDIDHDKEIKDAWGA